VPVPGIGVDVHVVGVRLEALGRVASGIERHREERDGVTVSVLLGVGLNVSLCRDEDGTDRLAVTVEKRQERRSLNLAQANLAGLEWRREGYVRNLFAPRGIRNVAALELSLGLPEGDVGSGIAEADGPETPGKATDRPGCPRCAEKRTSVHTRYLRSRPFGASGAVLEYAPRCPCVESVWLAPHRVVL
jgi:hypothetical protein